MEKEFFDAFPNLQVSKTLQELLELVYVTRVATTPDKSKLRVYIRCERWIHKKNILELENQIRRQCFADLPIQVKVIERFHLSEQYTPENFMEAYRDSMELELKQYGNVEYNLFHHAVFSFPEPGTMHMAIADSVVARARVEILREYLHKVFCERCGMDLSVEIELRCEEESRYRKNAALQIQQEAASIVRRAGLLHGEGEGSSNRPESTSDEESPKPDKEKEKESSKKEEAPQKKKEEKPEKEQGKKAGKGFTGRREEQRQEYRSARRDDNPDLIYGRDFEGDTIPLETITGEMGEVLIRGQVISVEAKIGRAHV